MTASLFDERCCALGEGPLWRPAREQIFWFDIVEKHLMSRFDLRGGQGEDVAALAPDNLDTRSNDGRPDPRGGLRTGRASGSAMEMKT